MNKGCYEICDCTLAISHYIFNALCRHYCNVTLPVLLTINVDIVCIYVVDYDICIIIVLLVYTGPVAIKKLNVSNPNESQLKAFKNEVQVLR